ncbi:expressed unknown protein [Seminavis robusta]|uniref:Transmembrane protein n=1 Tax=Seminavis robusta TaxID=568900 RepID=A0A9N8EI64_9STRA|nr:expressed unknown protein [Seminavis robusta]|eukprot:Sro1175_g249110.1 n/a (273) ;mRNA; f:2045-2863
MYAEAPSAEVDPMSTMQTSQPWQDTFYAEEPDIEAVFDVDIEAIRLYQRRTSFQFCAIVLAYSFLHIFLFLALKVLKRDGWAVFLVVSVAMVGSFFVAWVAQTLKAAVFGATWAALLHLCRALGLGMLFFWSVSYWVFYAVYTSTCMQAAMSGNTVPYGSGRVYMAIASSCVRYDQKNPMVSSAIALQDISTCTVEQRKMRRRCCGLIGETKTISLIHLKAANSRGSKIFVGVKDPRNFARLVMTIKNRPCAAPAFAPIASSSEIVWSAGVV